MVDLAALQTKLEAAKQQAESARGQADGLLKQADEILHPPPPPPRWQRRQRGPKHRGSKPRKGRASAVHVRRTNAWLRVNIGAYQGFMQDSILAALNDDGRSVIACSCGHLTICPADKADENWRSHRGSKR